MNTRNINFFVTTAIVPKGFTELVLMLLDPLEAGVNLFLGVMRAHKVNEWAKLILQLVASDLISWQFAEGSALMTGSSALIARGSGLVCGAVLCTVIWRRSPLTRGLMLALPAKEAEVELDSNTQVINK